MHPEIFGGLQQTVNYRDFLDTVNMLLCGGICGTSLFILTVITVAVNRRHATQPTPSEKSVQEVSPGSRFNYPTKAAPASARTQARHDFPQHGDNFDVAADSDDIIRGIKSRLN